MKSRLVKWSALGTVAVLVLPTLAFAGLSQNAPICMSVPELDPSTMMGALAILGAGATLVIEKVRHRSVR